MLNRKVVQKALKQIGELDSNSGFNTVNSGDSQSGIISQMLISLQINTTFKLVTYYRTCHHRIWRSYAMDVSEKKQERCEAIGNSSKQNVYQVEKLKQRIEVAITFTLALYEWLHSGSRTRP